MPIPGEAYTALGTVIVAIVGLLAGRRLVQGRQNGTPPSTSTTTSPAPPATPAPAEATVPPAVLPGPGVLPSTHPDALALRTYLETALAEEKAERAAERRELLAKIAHLTLERNASWDELERAGIRRPVVPPPTSTD